MTGDMTTKGRLALTSLALTMGVATGCADDTPAPMPQTTQPTDPPSQPTPSDADRASRHGGGDRDPEAVGTLVEQLEVPWGVDFLPDGDAVVTERMTGRVLQVTSDGTPEPARARSRRPSRRARPGCWASPCRRTSPPTGPSSSTSPAARTTGW